MLIDINVPVETVQQITVTATKLDVKIFSLDYDEQKFIFYLDFGTFPGGVFESQREAILQILGGPVFAGLIGTVAPGVEPLFTEEIPDIIGTVITTLNSNPSLIDGENVILTYLPIEFTVQ